VSAAAAVAVGGGGAVVFACAIWHLCCRGHSTELVRFLLTGTPVQNAIEEVRSAPCTWRVSSSRPPTQSPPHAQLWSLANFAMPTIFCQRERFLSVYR